MSNENTQGETFVTIQILRGIAALGVVYFHCVGEGGFSGFKKTGAWGVDIFFIMSGFIIAYIVSKNTKNFIIKRIFRVVPLYFIATFSIVFIAIIFPNLIHGTKISVEKIIKSILFIPYEDELKQNLPILGPGWTLNFEMFFYLIMAFCVFFVKNKKYISIICSVVLIVCMFIFNIVKSESFILEYYRSYNGGLFPEFIYGLLLHNFYCHLKSKQVPPCLLLIVRIICTGIIISSFVYLIASDVTGLYFSGNRNLQKGIPALLLVIASLFLEKNINGKNIVVQFFVLLGDASYVMYLFHYHIIAFLSRVIFQSFIGNNNGIIVEILKLLFTIIVTVIICVYLYKLVDIPIQKKLKKIFVMRHST
jgi:peptidoglycan/LPS O-acetylase OafA/YrhL